jgi:hypothetical protein
MPRSATSRPGGFHLLGHRQQQAGDAVGVDQLVEMCARELLDDPASPAGTGTDAS